MGKGRRNRSLTGAEPSIAELFDDGRAIDEALRLGVEDALRRHKLLGQRVATWKNGRVVILEPHEIPVDTNTEPPERRQRRARSTRRRRR
jgi:hypothetical protein